jgi:predicted O-linked N-acetylglucosamine transferase (SPINDLY family)
LWRNDNAEAYLNLGILYYETESYQEAISTLVKALGIDASNPLISYNLGLVLEKLKNDQQAISAYREAIKIAPNLIDAYNNLGNLLTKQEKMAEAESVYRKAIAANPEHFGSYLNLGNFLLERNQVNNAIEVYQTALALNPTHPDILNNLEIALQAKKYPTQFLLNLGEKLYQKNRYEEAIESYKMLLETELAKVEVYLNLRDCYINLNQIEEAISILQEGIHYHPKAGILRFYLIEILRQSGRTKEAITSATDAARQLPYEYVFKILSFLMLPIVYSTTDEVRFYRKQFARGLQNLIEQTSLETPEEKTMALKGVSSVTNFYLVYQAHNDRDLQHQYGNLVHQITAANYPKWVEPLSLHPLQENQKIRVGYISAYLHAYSGTYWLLGWLRHGDRQNFEIYCYYTGNDPDIITQQFQQYSDVFHHIPGNLEAVSQQILDDRLHILVFPEIGMDAPTIPIASLRLAPVQCTAWGHPVTSGLPTIDYYLSSELMEPENAQEHYTETLIRLPNLAIAYP